jgi:hypothetical protein
MVFNISYNKFELEIYDKHMCTQTILIGDRAKTCSSLVEKFKSNKDLDINNILDEMTQDVARSFDIH